MPKLSKLSNTPVVLRFYKDGTVLEVTYIVGIKDVPCNVHDGITGTNGPIWVGQGGHALRSRIEENFTASPDVR